MTLAVYLLSGGGRVHCPDKPLQARIPGLNMLFNIMWSLAGYLHVWKITKQISPLQESAIPELACICLCGMYMSIQIFLHCVFKKMSHLNANKLSFIYSSYIACFFHETLHIWRPEVFTAQYSSIRVVLKYMIIQIRTEFVYTCAHADGLYIKKNMRKELFFRCIYDITN